MRPCNEWLEFNGRKAPVYYLCGYVPTGDGADAISQSLLSFKNRYYPAMQLWLQYASEDFDTLEKDRQDLMFRALGHDEIRATFKTEAKSPLAFLCQKISKRSKIRYPFEMIKKKSETKPLKFLTKEERWEAVKDNFQVCDGFTRRQFRTFWFMDDIITTGATARAVWKALLEYYPDIDFRVYTLARTVHNPTFNMDQPIDETFQDRRDYYYDHVLEEEEPYLKAGSDLRKLPIPKFNNEDTFFV